MEQVRNIETQGGQRLDLLVAGGLNVVRLPRALAAPAAKRTIISTVVAEQVARTFGAVRRTSAGALGRFQGPTTKVDIAIDGFVAVDVVAVVSKLPPGVDAVVGEDVLARAMRVGRAGARQMVSA